MALESARKIVREKGIEALSTRAVASGIGYTVGTLYQVFRNMDDLVHQVNQSTLERLLDACTLLGPDASVSDRLKGLAKDYIAFAQANPQEWRAVISYPYSPDFEWSKEYDHVVEQLLGLMTSATKEHYSADEQEEQIQDMRLLWSSLYGIFSLDAAGRLGKKQSVEDMARRLVGMYVAGREKS